MKTALFQFGFKCLHCAVGIASILTSQLEMWVGIFGTALKWFRLYLAERTFCVQIDHVQFSSALSFFCGAQNWGLCFFPCI